MKMNSALNQSIAIALTLLAITACSRQKDTEAPMPRTNGATENTTPQTMTEPQTSAKQLNDVVQDGSGKTVLYWYDPMMSDKHFNKPGKSPFMDMQLVPRYAEGEKP
jgi:membrane fusion protein, copper/silver efflux system